MSFPPGLRDALMSALRERLGVIADRALYQQDPVGHLDRLRRVSEHIAALSSQLPADIDPQLTHYFQRSSFDKALTFLEAC